MSDALKANLIKISLKPICDYLEKKIKTKVNFISEDILKIKRDDLFKEPEESCLF